MAKISAYEFIMMMYNGKGIDVNKWYHDENGAENCIHKHFESKYDEDLYTFCIETEVIQFKVTKKNHIDIICCEAGF